MDNYDNIAHDLKQTIDEYRQNLESLKERFADIGNIISHLDNLKLQAQHSELKGEELFVKMADLELKHADLSKKMAALSADYESALTNLRNQHNEWSTAVEGVVHDVSASITDLRSDYNDKLNKAVAEIALQAKQEAASIDKYLQHFSKTQVTELKELARLLGEKIASAEIQSAQKIAELQTAVMFDLKTTRKINLAGFIAILVFIIGLTVYLVISQ
jgi:chromosome segregation ATPase